MKAAITLPRPGLFLSIIFLLAGRLCAQTTNISGPAGSGSFGYSVTVLTNGNYVVVDPYWDNGAITNVGAVYLYNGATHTLISTLRGSTMSDNVGIAGITSLPNGNFVVKSTNWKNGATISAGAVTWINGTTGLNGVVSSANSLVGSSSTDILGQDGITVLTNGNYVVASTSWDNGAVADAGAVTWCSGTTGRTGVVSSANSLVGSSAGDRIGIVMALTNGNYVVRSINWDNGAATDAGAVTWGSGTTGIAGVVSSANSLVGSTASDQVGASALIALTNGNYVVGSQAWDNGAITAAGAATWCSGTTGRTGTISSANSLVGDHNGAEVGNRLTALTNGNYVVRSPFWNNGAVSNAGAVTWGNGATGTTGTVTTANSLTGSSTDDQVGASATALTNGNYVVYSTSWNNGAVVDAGAVTWGSGTAAITGTVSSANSLVGTTANDQAGFNSVIALTNGNYVVSTYAWHNGAINIAGAVTWCNGTTGRTGAISTANSLVGSTAGDQIGLYTIALTNGNYATGSSFWDNGAISDVGAFRLCNGTTGTTGILTSANSLVGTTASDQVGGSNGLKALTNGNYLVVSSFWDNGAAANAGAVTWCSGSTATTGPVSSTNSLVGSTASDLVGLSGVTALTNGNYVVNSRFWDNGAIADAGAVTWGNGTTGTKGAVSLVNSLIGGKASDFAGDIVATLVTPDGNYISHHSVCDNGAIDAAGAVSFGNGSTGTTGIITECNSVVGTVPSLGYTMLFTYDTTYDQLIVGKPSENMVSVFDTAGTNTLASTAVCHAENVLATGTDYKNSCKLIARVIPSGTNPVSGSINACVTLDATQQFYNAEPYVQRHYDIEPATANTTTTSATITLYFTDAEFSAFNTNNPAWPKMPTVAGGGNIDPNRANLKITQYHGTATSSPSQPGMYSVPGAGVYINPNDADIVWNGLYWAVTFNVAGFSGFYVHSNPVSPLPVGINYFRGVKRNSDHLLDWKISCNGAPGVTMVLERSDHAAGPFTGINSITADAAGCNQPFNYTDAQPLKGMNYYRLKITDDNGKTSYSNMVALLNAAGGFEITGIVPNPVPATGIFKFNISSATASMAQLNITDMQGRLVMQDQQNIIAGFNSIDMNVNSLAAGTYYISAVMDDGKRRLVRFVKQ